MLWEGGVWKGKKVWRGLAFEKKRLGGGGM
jgi:hypothetical protein